MNVYEVRIASYTGDDGHLGYVEARSQLEAAAIVTRYRRDWDRYRLTFSELAILRDVEWG